MPFEEYRTCRQRRALALLACYVPRRKHGGFTRPMSRDEIRRRSGFSADSQRRYERSAGVEVRRNVVELPYDPRGEVDPTPFWWKHGGRTYTNIGNSFNVPGVRPSGRRVAVRVNARLAHKVRRVDGQTKSRFFVSDLSGWRKGGDHYFVKLDDSASDGCDTWRLVLRKQVLMLAEAPSAVWYWVLAFLGTARYIR